MTRRTAATDVQDVEDTLANEFADQEIIRVLQAAYEQNPSEVNKFQYALVLRQDKSVQSRQHAINLFKSLANDERYSRDSFYYTALTYYSLRDFKSALFFCEKLFLHDPDNEQIRKLYSAIDSKFQHSTAEKAKNEAAAIGVGVGLLALGVGVAIALTRKK